MKKIFLLVFSILIITLNNVQAINVADFTPALDKKVAKLKTTDEKIKYLKSLSDSLNSTKYTKSKDAQTYKRLRDYILNMLDVFEYELQEEQTKNNSKILTSSNEATLNKNTNTQKISKSNLPHISDNFSNINVQKIRDTILSWHNEERNNVGVKTYTYNLNLEGSATIWANKLAESGKTKNLHLRNTGDGYYNYNSLLNRFLDLGINFPKSVKGGASFSETIGRNVYKCNKSDCTQDLITAVKKTWTGLIIKEKSNNGSHYRAATMKHFTQMGAGIAFDKSNNRYYIVIHYGVEF